MRFLLNSIKSGQFLKLLPPFSFAKKQDGIILFRTAAVKLKIRFWQTLQLQWPEGKLKLAQLHAASALQNITAYLKSNQNSVSPQFSVVDRKSAGVVILNPICQH